MSDITFDKYEYQALKYFAEIVSFDTTADPAGIPPQTLKRFKPCAQKLATLLREIGLEDVKISKEAYVYATLPANLETAKAYTIVLMSHYDTATDHSSEGAQLAVHKHYSGGNIVLDHNGAIVSADELKGYSGQDIVTGLGNAQIGADDKVGIAEILDAMNFLVKNPQIKRPTIKIVFNHNEEVGRGIEFLNFQSLAADYAYCVDGGEVGNLFQENFNAEEVNIKITGITVHPGWAKDKMINAISVARELENELAKDFAAPENSEKREPYLAVREHHGTWAETTVKVMLRAFDREQIDKMKTGIDTICTKLMQKYTGITIDQQWEKHHRYQNSGEILTQHPLVNQVAAQAYTAVGVKPIPDYVRGGFDGVNMSFAGLPTTNVFNCARNMHALTEWVSVQEMELSVRMLVHLVNAWSNYTKN